MAMAEPRWHYKDEREPRSGDERVLAAEQRARAAEEQRVQAEGRCFAAERRRLDAERQLEQIQRLLAQARTAGVRMQALVGELGELARHLRGTLDRPRRDASVAPEDADGAEERAEMADALAAAVERLRARVTAVDELEPRRAPTPSRPVSTQLPMRPAHKHSLSAIARLRNRWRNRRKQRRAA